MIYWSDDKTNFNEDKSKEEELDMETPLHDAPKKTFGPIPRFSRVYEVKANGDPKVFSCTCCNQERMGMSCQHIACVCQGNNTILGDNSIGFPLLYVRVFWWNQYCLYMECPKRRMHETKLVSMLYCSSMSKSRFFLQLVIEQLRLPCRLI
jgi:hypothetical protein